MTFSPEQVAALQAPLDRANVKKNPRGYDYVEGWQVIAEANRIFGFHGWQRETVALQQTAEPYQTNGKWRVGYLARVMVRVLAGDVWTAREGTGYGSGVGGDLNDCHESAAKEAETDAMKRALMTFGNPFGLALYDKTQAHVADAAPAKPASPPKMTPAEWVDGEAQRLDAMVKRGDIDGVQNWPASEAKFLAGLLKKDPAAHEKAMRMHATTLASIRAAG